VALADAVHAEVLGWDSFERWSTGLQLVRSVDSVGANIAEAVGRWHEADKRRILFIARGSLYETEHWLRTAAERELLEGSYSSQVNEIARALNGLIRRPIPR
jgi:four helix bundle protein